MVWITTTHHWCDSHSISISDSEVWGIKARIQVSKREFHVHIHLDYVKIKFLFCIKKMVWIKNFQNVLVLGDSDKIIEVISKQEKFLLLVY